MYDVIGFGALNLDYIYSVDSLSILSHKLPLQPGQEIFFSERLFPRIKALIEEHGKLKQTSGGGSAANTIFALDRMRFKTGFIGKVGRDEAGDLLLKSLGGVDTGHIRRQGKSGACLIVIDKREDRSIMAFPNTNKTVTIGKKEITAVNNSRFLHLSSFVGGKSLSSQIRLVENLPSQVRLSFDPGEIYASKGLKEIFPIIQKGFVLFLTDREIEKLTGKRYRAGCRELLAMGPSIVVCKRGRQGAYVLSREEEFHVLAEEVPVVDNTGAGDVYNAGFLAGLLMGRPLRPCGLFATRMAAKSVTGYGRSRYPTDKDLTNFFQIKPGHRAQE
ncbi:MAG: PfkB family carbohydrate kinase [Thermodesulfobacteriota bacterium]